MVGSWLGLVTVPGRLSLSLRKDGQQELRDLKILVKELPTSWQKLNIAVCIYLVFGPRRVMEAAT